MNNRMIDPADEPTWWAGESFACDVEECCRADRNRVGMMVANIALGCDYEVVADALCLSSREEARLDAYLGLDRADREARKLRARWVISRRRCGAWKALGLRSTRPAPRQPARHGEGVAA